MQRHIHISRLVSLVLALLVYFLMAVWSAGEAAHGELNSARTAQHGTRCSGCDCEWVLPIVSTALRLSGYAHN